MEEKEMWFNHLNINMIFDGLEKYIRIRNYESNKIELVKFNFQPEVFVPKYIYFYDVDEDIIPFQNFSFGVKDDCKSLDIPFEFFHRENKNLYRLLIYEGIFFQNVYEWISYFVYIQSEKNIKYDIIYQVDRDRKDLFNKDIPFVNLIKENEIIENFNVNHEFLIICYGKLERLKISHLYKDYLSSDIIEELMILDLSSENIPLETYGNIINKNKKLGCEIWSFVFKRKDKSPLKIETIPKSRIYSKILDVLHPDGTTERYIPFDFGK